MWSMRQDRPFPQAGWAGFFVVLLTLVFVLQAGAGDPDAEILPPGVSVRQGPAMTTPIVAELQAGVQVEILFTQRGPAGSWAQIALPSGRMGFVPEQALRRLGSPPQWRSANMGSTPASINRRVGDGVLDIPLKHAGGLFLVTARINEQVTTNFIVDTGATVVMISETLADQLGLDYVNKPKQRIVTASGFLESPRILLGSIHVPDEGGVGATNIAAHVATLPDAPPTIGGLLGQSFLRHFHVTIDAERAVMHLRPVRP